MPSFVVDKDNVVIGVMSYDPVSPEQHHIPTYDTSIVGKRHENGQFVEVVTVQNQGQG